MPVSYEFRDPGSDVPVNRAFIDDQMCADAGVEAHPIHYTLEAKAAWLGIAILVAMGGSYITAEMFDQYVEERPELKEKEGINLFRTYLAGEKYTFHAWR